MRHGLTRRDHSGDVYAAAFCAARTIGATSVPRSSIERFMAAVASEAVLIWKVMREIPPSVSLASSILAATVAGAPIRKAPSGLAIASNCWRVGVDHPRSRPMVPVRCAQPGKKASLASASVSPTKPIACTPTTSFSAACPARLPGLAVEIDERTETLERAADNGDHQRKAELARALEGSRRAADAHPQRQPRLMGTREDALSVECRPIAPVPGDVGLLAEFQEQVELFGEQVVIGAGVEAEQRKGFSERASPDDDFGASPGNQVQRREFLENPYRVGCAQHRHRARQTDLARPGGGGRKNDGRRGIEKLGAMVLADAEDVEPDTVGGFNLVKQIRHAIGRGRKQTGRRVGKDGCKAVDAYFHGGSRNALSVLMDLEFGSREGSGERRSATRLATKIRGRPRALRCRICRAVAILAP